MNGWIYKRTEPGLWTVGFMDGDGTWWPESDYNHPDEAANRVHFLNGGSCRHANQEARDEQP